MKARRCTLGMGWESSGGQAGRNLYLLDEPVLSSVSSFLISLQEAKFQIMCWKAIWIPQYGVLISTP